jgi:predicted acyltransferase (DUF342 family)
VIILPFLAFAIIFIMLICAHFVPAYRAWLRSRSVEAPLIDPSYVRIEDYFARSFRMKISEWMKLPVFSASPDGTRMIKKGRERLRISQSCQYPPLSKSDDILVVQGAFRCGAGSIFHREIYVSGDANVGEGSRLQAVAADGNLTIGKSARITRWVDCAGELEIGADATVASRATAGRIIRLRKGALVLSAYAPTVSTVRPEREHDEMAAVPEVPELEIPVADAHPTMHSRLAQAGIDTKKLVRLATNCWSYDGDLKPSAPLLIRTGLIVRGDCVLPSGSVVEGDIKAKASIIVGERSLCKGNMIADGDISLGPWTRFHGVVWSGKELRINPGVRGGDDARKTAAYAADNLLLAEDVIVHGKVCAGNHVVVGLQ